MWFHFSETGHYILFHPAYKAFSNFMVLAPVAYGIDVNQAVFEKVPLVVAPVTNISLTRTSHRTAGRNE